MIAFLRGLLAEALPHRVTLDVHGVGYVALIPLTTFDKLPQIGPARAKAIVEARAKAKFKDWSDFDTRNVVPQNAEAAIKDLVIVR